MQPKEKLREKVLSYYYDSEKEEMKKGIGDVADKVGLSTQTLRDLVSGRSKVTLDTLIAFATAYPQDFSGVMDEVMGIKPIDAVVVPDTTSPSATVLKIDETEKINHKDEIIALLKKQVESIERDKEFLMRDNERLFQIAHPQLFVDQEGSKIGSSSHTTAGDNFDIFGSVRVSQDRTSERDAMRVKGFEVGQASASENEVKIVKMPVDYFTHVKVNRLNSLAPMVKKTA